MVPAPGFKEPFFRENKFCYFTLNHHNNEVKFFKLLPIIVSEIRELLKNNFFISLNIINGRTEEMVIKFSKDDDYKEFITNINWTFCPIFDGYRQMVPFNNLSLDEVRSQAEALY